MENFYVKVGKRYKKVAVGLPHNSIPMGVYYVRDNGNHLTNVDYYGIKVDDVLDIKLSVSKIDLADELVKAISKDPNIAIYESTLYDKCMEIAEDLLRQNSNYSHY